MAEPAFLPPWWMQGIPLEDLEISFGQPTVKRGAAHQRRGAVHDLTEDHHGGVSATVYGTRRYRTSVWWEPLTDEGDDVDLDDIYSECSCSTGINCEHAVALILQARSRDALPASRRARRAPTQPTLPRAAHPPPPPWESLLEQAVADARPAPVDPDLTPLALQFETTKAMSHDHRPTTALRLRPLLRGASGAWIKTGIAWTMLQYPYSMHQVDPRHRTALTALLNAVKAISPYWYAAGEWIDTDALGPSLWRLLDDVRDAGVALVTGHQGRYAVRLAPEPAEVVLDLTRDSEGDIRLHFVVDLADAPAPAVLLGRPGHGLLSTTGTDMTLAALARPLTPGVMTLLGRADELRIPTADAERFLTRYYPTLRQQVRVTSSDDGVEFPLIEPPRLGLEVYFEAEHRTQLHWSFRYAVGRQVHAVPLLRGQPGDDGSVVRDPESEERLLASLDVLDGAPGLRIQLPGKTRLGVVLDPVLESLATARFVRDVLPALQVRDDVDVEIVGEPLPYEQIEEAPVVSVSARELGERGTDDQLDVGSGRAEAGAQQDWFDLGIEVSIGGRPVPLPTLLTALTHDDEHLLLPDGTWFALDVPELHTLRRIVEEARAVQDRPGTGLRINRYQAGLWEELVSLGVVAEQSARWERTVGALLGLDELPAPDPPEGLLATLRAYQLDGYRWLSLLWDHDLGGILADDMGLGKTMQTLAAAERARADGRLTPERPMLVVAPTSVVSTWQREAARFTPQLKVVALTQTVHRAGQPLADTIADAHVVVTTYALLRIDEDHLTEREWSAVVLDEAQAVKNHQSRTYKAARSLRAPLKLAITGTPLENSLMDLWALLSIVAPGLFPNPQRFGQLYRKPIESGRSPDLLATLRRRIRPLMLRRTKEAVATDLPPKIEQVVRVPLNAGHRRIYDTHLQRERQRILGLLDDVDRNRIAILTALTRLRQLSLDPHLVLADLPDTVRPSKADALLEQLVEVVAEEHRCLVFSQFTRFLKVVRDRLDAEGIEHVYLDGRTRDRPRRIAQFTDGAAPVFLISLKAGGSGLTLTEADYVFVLDPWWNPAVEAQAVDRTHRIGQDKTVMVYRLVAEDTIEEKVVALQEHKRDLFAKVVDDGGLMAAPLSAEDIRGLLEG